MAGKTAEARVSLTEARKITLYCQGLSSGSAFDRGSAGALAALERLGYVQIDTISVVARAHHHVLWSRVRDFSPEALEQLVRQGQAFEYWSHAASYLPMRDFRFSLPRKRLYASGKLHWFKPSADYERCRRLVLNRIRAEGPLTSRDFLPPGGRKGGGGWFERTPAKQALEQLFMEGRLMVAGRDGFQKRYELTERVLPDWVDRSFPSLREQVRHLIASGLKAHGFLRPDEIAYLRSRPVRAAVDAESEKMLRAGELLSLRVEGVERPYLASGPAFSSLRDSALAARPARHILSPFDNLVIRRKRLQELFGFDYLIECYVPEAKRIYGYYCLPLLDGSKFAGRLDAKAWRDRGLLEVRSLHPHGKDTIKRVRGRFRRELEALARFQGCSGLATGRL
jgi:uncharacterized protein